MRELTKLDKFLLLLGFLIVIGIFALAIVIYIEGGQCVIDPVNYAVSKHILIPPESLKVSLP